MGLTMSWVSAAWVIVNATQAVAAFEGDFKESYWATYSGASAIGDNLGLYELISFLAYAMWSLTVTLGSLYVTSNVWTMTDNRVAGASAGSIVVDPLTAVKFFTLEVLMGLMTLIGGYALGDTADNLLAW